MGAPWEAQEGAKLEQNRSLEAVFFVKLKRHSYKKWSWNALLLVLGAPRPRWEVTHGMGKAPSGHMGKLHFGIKNAIFPIGFLRFCKIVPVCPQ